MFVNENENLGNISKSLKNLNKQKTILGYLNEN